MAEINVILDTEPMAKTIKTVTSHVDIATGAMTAMQTAVIAAEKNSATVICSNVDRGFFSLIRSQLGQKMARLQSDIDAKLAVLKYMSDTLNRIKNQMESDYYRIGKRYGKLFSSLNKTLQNRVFELDMAASDLSAKQLPNMMCRMRDNCASIIVHQTESVPFMQLTTNITVKKNSSTLIRMARNNLMNYVDLGIKLKSNTMNKHLNERKELYLPILIIESDSNIVSKSLTQLTFPEFSNNTNLADIQNFIVENIKQLKWVATNKEERTNVEDDILQLCEERVIDQRIREQIVRLYTESEWSKIEAITL